MDYTFSNQTRGDVDIADCSSKSNIIDNSNSSSNSNTTSEFSVRLQLTTALVVLLFQLVLVYLHFLYLSGRELDRRNYS